MQITSSFMRVYKPRNWDMGLFISGVCVCEKYCNVNVGDATSKCIQTGPMCCYFSFGCPETKKTVIYRRMKKMYREECLSKITAVFKGMVFKVQCCLRLNRNASRYGRSSTSSTDNNKRVVVDAVR